MKIRQIHIENYRSLGSETKIHFDSDIVALIGKNESGKTNVLQALSEIKFFEPVPVLAFKAANRFIADAKVKISFEMIFDESEICQLFKLVDGGITYPEEIHFSFEKYGSRTVVMTFDGLLQKLMKSDRKLVDLQEALSEILPKLLENRQGDERVKLEGILHYVTNATSCYMPLPETGDVKWLCAHYLNTPEKAVSAKHLKELQEILNKWHSEFVKYVPTVVMVDESELQNSYTIDEIKRPPPNNLVALNRFLDSVGSTREQLLAALEHSDEGERNSRRGVLQKSSNKLMEKFNAEYSTEKISLYLGFDQNKCTFSLSSGDTGKSVLHSERSAGLRWYLNTFMELERAKLHRNALILIDEPGAHLHVNAQKEVCTLLEKLANSGKQILYATHSPFMLDQNSLGRIKAVVKDTDITKIRDIHTLNTSNELCKHEVLAPLCFALGCDLKHNIGPAATRKNLIVEGITDYYYLTAMMDCLRIDKDTRPFVIPSCGASSIHHIVSIMMGWGCEFMVLIDSDKGGKDEQKVLRKNFGSAVENLIFPVALEDGKTIESLLDQEDREECSDSSKIINAKRFYDDIGSKTRAPSKSTIENFRELFNRIGVFVTVSSAAIRQQSAE